MTQKLTFSPEETFEAQQKINDVVKDWVSYKGGVFTASKEGFIISIKNVSRLHVKVRQLDDFISMLQFKLISGNGGNMSYPFRLHGVLDSQLFLKYDEEYSVEKSGTAISKVAVGKAFEEK